MDGVEVGAGPASGRARLTLLSRARRTLQPRAPGALPTTVFLYEYRKGNPPAVLLHGSVELHDVVAMSQHVREAWGSKELWKVLTRFGPRHDVAWNVRHVNLFAAGVAIPWDTVGSWTPMVRFKLNREHVDRCNRLGCRSNFGFRVHESLLQLMMQDKPFCLTSPTFVARVLGVKVPADLSIGLIQSPPPVGIIPPASIEPIVAADIIQATTRPSRWANVGFEYRFDTIAHALQLQWLAKNISIPIRTLCHHVWNMTLQPRIAGMLHDAVDAGQMKLPGVTKLKSATRKLDVLMSLWYRHEIASVCSHRYIIPDSSPQAGWNLLCVIEDRICWPSCMTVDAQVLMDLGRHSEERIYPLSTLGLGASSAEHKSWNIYHMMLIESGSRVEQHRMEVRCVCSDQGAEAAIADAGNIDACALSVLLRRLEAGELRASDMDAAELGYLFPHAIFIPDHCHMIFGGLKEACSGVDLWSPLEGALRSIGTFLNRRMVKDRFVEICLPAVSRGLFKARSAGYVDWKWEYMHKFIDHVRPLLPLLIKHFDATALPRENGKDSAKDIKVINNVRDALLLPNLLGLVEVAHALTTTCDRAGTWFEGISLEFYGCKFGVVGGAHFVFEHNGVFMFVWCGVGILVFVVIAYVFLIVHGSEDCTINHMRRHRLHGWPHYALHTLIFESSVGTPTRTLLV